MLQTTTVNLHFTSPKWQVPTETDGAGAFEYCSLLGPRAGTLNSKSLNGFVFFKVIFYLIPTVNARLKGC